MSNTDLHNEGNINVLIVDDEPLQAESLREVISLYEYDVRTSGSGSETITCLKQNSVDILLLDLNMPGVNGFDVIDFVVENRMPCKIIVLSGDARFESARKALRKGAYDFLKKPFLPDELLTTMNNVAEIIRLETANHAIKQQLEESEQLHRFIVENSPDVVFMLDTEGRFTFVNDAVSRILGYSKSELAGRHCSAVITEHDSPYKDHFLACIQSNNGQPGNMELAIKVKGGEHRYFETSTLPVILNRENRSIFQGTYCVAHDVTDKKQAQELINYQAYHDLLTDLPNRYLLEDRLCVAITQAKRNREKLALMFLDLDRFKWVNDTMGHAAGDRLLQEVGQRLANCLREADTLARFGGDEFALLLPRIHKHEDVIIIADKIIDEFKQSFVIDGTELYVTSSIGIAVYPEAGETIASLVKNADLAMYSVKDKGKNAYEFFNKNETRAPSAHLKMEQDLRHALANNELRVCYQPKVRTHTEKVVGFEALVRWQHPARGIIMPDDFIPIAEETSQIRDVGDFVLDTVCRDLGTWRDCGIDNIRVSINYSASQINQENFVEKIENALKQYNLPAQCLEIEITEDTLMNHMSHLVRKLHRLKETGIEIAVDDFGTGYSSFNYLQQFPINTLKIDKSFIQSIHTKKGGASIVNAIVAMAKGLDLNLVAEGVETDSQLEYLKQLGCPEIQGWLFGKAESADQTRMILDRIMRGEKFRSETGSGSGTNTMTVN